MHVNAVLMYRTILSSLFFPYKVDPNLLYLCGKGLGQTELDLLLLLAVQDAHLVVLRLDLSIDILRKKQMTTSYGRICTESTSANAELSHTKCTVIPKSSSEIKLKLQTPRSSRSSRPSLKVNSSHSSNTSMALSSETTLSSENASSGKTTSNSSTSGKLQDSETNLFVDKDFLFAELTPKTLNVNSQKLLLSGKENEKYKSKFVVAQKDRERKSRLNGRIPPVPCSRELKMPLSDYNHLIKLYDSGKLYKDDRFSYIHFFQESY